MPPIVLTPLESILVGGVISLLSGLSVSMFMRDSFVRRKECMLQREMIMSHKRDMNVIFAMLRAVIAHMDNLTPEERERILNLRLNGGSD